MPVLNVMEMMIRRIFEDDFLPRVPMCSCQQCHDDVLAWTLNRFPSKYVSTDKGQVYVQAQYFDPQLRTDIFRELTVAAEKVAKNPRHEAGWT